MTEANTVSAEALSTLLARVSEVTWPFPEADVPALAEQWGWQVTRIREGRSVSADTGFAVNRTHTELEADKGFLTEISLNLTDAVLEETPWRADFLRDAFANAVTVTTGVLGQPTKRIRKPDPQVWWEVPSGARVTILMLAMAVILTVDSAEYAAVLRELG